MNTQIVKQHCWGRTWRSANIRQELIEAVYASGLSRAEFCKERAINLNTFYGWLAKKRKSTLASAFQEVQISFPVSRREVRVCLSNRMEVTISVDSLAELTLVLQEAARC